MNTAFARHGYGDEKIEEVDYEKLPEKVRLVLEKLPEMCMLYGGKLYGKTKELVTEEEFEGWTAFYRYSLLNTKLSASSIKELLRFLRSEKFHKATYLQTSALFSGRGFTVEDEDFFTEPFDIPPADIAMVISYATALGTHAITLLIIKPEYDRLRNSDSSVR